MNKINCKIKSVALSDGENIVDYIKQDHPTAAIKLFNKFNDTFKLLCSHPNMGFIKDEFKYKNVRFYKVKKHYLIVYNFENDEINILRVLSSYQDIIDKL